jgi:hypothetical protein
MPKKIKDKNKSIFVKFYEDIDDKEINSLLVSMGVFGTRVSNLINRWAIEVPFWREESFMTKFSENELVEKVHEGFERKRKSLIEEAEENE